MLHHVQVPFVGFFQITMYQKLYAMGWGDTGSRCMVLRFYTEEECRASIGCSVFCDIISVNRVTFGDFCATYSGLESYASSNGVWAASIGT